MNDTSLDYRRGNTLPTHSKTAPQHCAHAPHAAAQAPATSPILPRAPPTHATVLPQQVAHAPQSPVQAAATPPKKPKQFVATRDTAAKHSTTGFPSQFTPGHRTSGHAIAGNVQPQPGAGQQQLIELQLLQSAAQNTRCEALLPTAPTTPGRPPAKAPTATSLEIGCPVIALIINCCLV